MLQEIMSETRFVKAKGISWVFFWIREAIIGLPTEQTKFKVTEEVSRRDSIDNVASFFSLPTFKP